MALRYGADEIEESRTRWTARHPGLFYNSSSNELIPAKVVIGDSEYPMKLTYYPDGSPIVKTGEQLYEGGFKPQTDPGVLMVQTANLGELTTALLFAESMRQRGFSIEHLVIPYVPGARQDRDHRSPGSDYLLTARGVAKLINSFAFKSVTIVDPHSTVIENLIDRVNVITPAHLMLAVFGYGDIPYAAVIAPDHGAVRRATEVARVLEVPLIIGNKIRDVNTGHLSDFSIDMPGDWKDQAALVVDDICDGGGTFIGLANIIKNQRPTCRLDLWVTHGIFSKGIDTLRKQYDRIFTTNSLFSATVPGVFTVDVFRAIISNNYEYIPHACKQ